MKKYIIGFILGGIVTTVVVLSGQYIAEKYENSALTETNSCEDFDMDFYTMLANDVERQSAVQIIGTIMKIMQIDKEENDYSTNTDVVGKDSREKLDERLFAQGYKTPAGKNELCYYYGYNSSDFFIAVGAEELSKDRFIAGTPEGIIAIREEENIRANTVKGLCNTLSKDITESYTVISWLK